MDDHEDSEKRERVLLRPWLENLIESGSIPGLEWVDDNKTMFKVPWKHRSKKTWSLRHSSIFLEWAKNTGRWSEGDAEPNYAQLKTRLRCAFNKAPDIEEMRELHRTKAEEPYKVYKFIPRKESKLYPFGRRPLRKTTVPITVRRRRYFIARMASTYLGVSNARHAALPNASSSVVRIKEEKDILNNSYGEMMNEESFYQNQNLDIGSSAPVPFHENEAKDQIGRILPLIVEEANTNSMDMESPMTKDKEIGSKMSSSVLPEIIRNQIDPEKEFIGAPFVGIPKLLEGDMMAKEEARHQEVFYPPSLTSEKLEYFQSRHKDSSTSLYASSRFASHPSSDLIFSDGMHSILPQLNEKIRNFESAVSNSSSTVPTNWSHSGPEVNSGIIMNHSPEFVHERQSSRSAQEPEMTSLHKSGLVPSARLLPLKKLIRASQNTLQMEKSSVDLPSVPEKRIDAIVKPNATTKPRVAVTGPYDIRSALENRRMLANDSAFNDINKDADLPELEVIDLSAKVSANEVHGPDSRVLDLTKKMIVTPFEHDGHVDLWRNSTKSCLADVEKDVEENLLHPDPAASMNELLKFKSDYRQKKQFIVTKTMFLVEKERELKAREKQLAAREEALFWKETYLHRVLSGFDCNGAIPASRSGSMAPYTPSLEARHGSASLIGSTELKEACLKGLSPSTMTLFTPQHSSGEASGRHHQPSSAVSITRPEQFNNLPGFVINSKDAKGSFLSSAATSASLSAMSRCVPVGTTRPVTLEDSRMMPKASLHCSSEQMKYNRNADLHFEPETDVALGDAYPDQKSYHLAVKKSQPDSPPSLMAANEMSAQPLLMTRKRGRPKGSKNKVKHVKEMSSTSPLMRQMPPLLVIQPSGMKESVMPDPGAQSPSLPFHFKRSGNLSDHREAVDSSETYSDNGRLVEAHGYKSHATSRILPPVTVDSSFNSCLSAASGKSRHADLTSHSVVPNHPSVAHSSLYDQASDKGVMPETVRQLLVSASRPVSTILPPLSPSRSPVRSSPEMKGTFLHYHDEKLSDEEKTVANVC